MQEHQQQRDGVGCESSSLGFNQKRPHKMHRRTRSALPGLLFAPQEEEEGGFGAGFGEKTDDSIFVHSSISWVSMDVNETEDDTDDDKGRLHPRLKGHKRSKSLFKRWFPSATRFSNKEERRLSHRKTKSDTGEFFEEKLSWDGAKLMEPPKIKVPKRPETPPLPERSKKTPPSLPPFLS